MIEMFHGCSSLIKLNIPNFNFNKLENMGSWYGMFYECSSLNELNLSNFSCNFEIEINNIFAGCPDKLKNRIKKE